MKTLRWVLCSTLILSGLFHQNVKAAPDSMIYARFDFDNIFRDQYFFAGAKFLSENVGVYAMFATFPDVKTMGLELGPVFRFGGFTGAVTGGVTFGPNSWTFSADKTERLGRDIGASLFLHYAHNLTEDGTLSVELESQTLFFFPLQETYTAAVDFGVGRNFAVIKWHNVGVGPFLNPLFTKNSGSSSYHLSHLGVGAVATWDLGKLNMRLFMGTDPISDSTWLGFGKTSGTYYKGQLYYFF